MVHDRVHLSFAVCALAAVAGHGTDQLPRRRNRARHLDRPELPQGPGGTRRQRG